MTIFKTRTESRGGGKHVDLLVYAAPGEDRTFAFIGRLTCLPTEAEALAALAVTPVRAIGWRLRDAAGQWYDGYASEAAAREESKRLAREEGIVTTIIRITAYEPATIEEIV